MDGATLWRRHRSIPAPQTVRPSGPFPLTRNGRLPRASVSNEFRNHPLSMMIFTFSSPRVKLLATGESKQGNKVKFHLKFYFSLASTDVVDYF
jgi:hypothetical protein